MLRKFLVLVWLSALVVPGWAQTLSIHREVPPDCQVRPVSATSPEGPIYDSRGFYIGYFRPLPKPAPAYVPPAPSPERSFMGEGESYGAYYDTNSAGYGSGFEAYAAPPRHLGTHHVVNPLGLPTYQVGTYGVQGHHHEAHGEGAHAEHAHGGGDHRH